MLCILCTSVHSGSAGMKSVGRIHLFNFFDAPIGEGNCWKSLSVQDEVVERDVNVGVWDVNFGGVNVDPRQPELRRTGELKAEIGRSPQIASILDAPVLSPLCVTPV